MVSNAVRLFYIATSPHCLLITNVLKVYDKTCDVTDQSVFMLMTIVCLLCSHHTCLKCFGNSSDVLNGFLSHFKVAFLIISN